MTPNAIFRFRARAVLKNNWQIALLVVFIASLPSILMQVAGVLTGGDISTRLMMLMEDTAFLSADPDSMLRQMTEALTGNGAGIYMVCSLLAFLVAPTLTAGMHHYMMGLHRGEPGEVSSVFSRVRWFLKALGLTLLVALKSFLWSVPGMALAIGGTAVIPALVSTVGQAVNLMMAVMTVGYILMFVLMIAAMLRYAMAMYAFAEKPETGILECIRISKTIMQRRKMQLFALEFSFIIWNLLVMLAYMLVASMFGPVIGLTVQMFLNLFVAAYQHCSITAFYLQYTADEKGEPSEEEVLRQMAQLNDEE